MAVCTISLIAGMASVENTSGRRPSFCAARLMRATASWALASLSMKGRRTLRVFRSSNWLSSDIATVSEVMPVPSEMK